jgi:acyl-CoA dehydrogenase
MDFNIPEEVKEVIEGLKSFINKEVIPLEKENSELLFNERNYYTTDGKRSPEVLELMKQVRMKSSKAGYYTMLGAEELGGAGFGPVAAVCALEAMNKEYGPGHKLIDNVVIPSPFTNGLSPVLTGLNQNLRDRYLEGIASGEKTMCFALSEPDAGSDVWSMKTSAVKDGNDWIINGTKQWITNAPYADYSILFACTDQKLRENRREGITCFFVETSTLGFNADSIIPIMGHLGGEVGIISLDNLRVPNENIIGELHQGFGKAMLGVDTGRLGMSGKCIGMAQWALKQGVEYSKIRHTFGSPISENQMIQLMLADSAIDIYAGKNMALNCAWKIENQEKLPIKEISMVKAFNTEMVGRVYDRMIQLHGGMGLTNELHLEEGFRWARTMRIPDGTSEIHRRTIAKRLLKGDLTF